MKKLIINLFVLAGLFLALTGCNNKNEPQISDFCDQVQTRDFQKVAENTSKFLATIDNSLSDEAKFEKLKNWLLAQDCVENIEVRCYFCVARGFWSESVLDITFNINDAEVTKTMGIAHEEPSWIIVIADVNPPSPLIDKTWTLIAIGGTEQKPNIVENYTIIFNEDGTLEFPLYCNPVVGSYSVDAVSFVFSYGSISFSFENTTQQYCGELSDLENFVTFHLSRAVMYSVQGKNLTIECEDDVYLFFEAM